MENLDREHLAIRAYLLGGLDEESRERIESRFMTDPDFKEVVLLVEDELFEDYAFGTLPPQEREDFARRFTSDPRHAQKLRLIEGLKGRAEAEDRGGLAGDVTGRRRAPFWRRWLPGSARFRGSPRTLKLAFAAAVLMLGSLLILEVSQRGRWRRDSREDIERELARLNAPADSGGAQYSGAGLYTLTLSPVQTRGAGDAPVIAVAGDEGLMQLRMTPLRGGRQSYRASVQEVSGAELFAVGGLRPDNSEGETVVLYVPVKFLPPGDYLLRLAGLPGGGGRDEDASEFYFRVVRR